MAHARGSHVENEVRHDAVPIEADGGEAMKYAYVHEVTAAVRRKFPQLTVTSDYPPGEPNSYTLDIKGGMKAGRDAAMEFAKRFAEGWLHKPTK